MEPPSSFLLHYLVFPYFAILTLSETVVLPWHATPVHNIWRHWPATSNNLWSTGTGKSKRQQSPSMMATTKKKMPDSIRPFLFSLLVVSSLSVKGIHLWSHLRSLSPFQWATSLPFLFVEDVVLAVLGRFLLARSCKAKSFLGRSFLGLGLTIITTVAASLDIAFFWETSSEIDWSASAKFLSDPVGMKVLLSGWGKILTVLIVLLALSTATVPSLYHAVGKGLESSVALRKDQFDSTRAYYRTQGLEEEHDEKKRTPTAVHQRFSVIFFYIGFLIFYLLMTVFYIQRTDIPSKHLLGSLPFTLIRNSHRTNGEFCVADNSLLRKPFPLSHLVRERQVGYVDEIPFNWAPWEFQYGKSSPLPSVSWLPKRPIKGFQRWYDADESSNLNHYNPRHDPLRISNTQSPVPDTIERAFQQNTVAIKNVLMITLESTRKDVFPMKKSSHLYNTILSTHGSSVSNDVLELLANISRTSEVLTGESSGFDTERIPTGTWRDLRSDFGGINVQCAITSASYTSKSLIAGHCGVAPLPVDFTQEATQEFYQPCLPHVLELFNTQKKTTDNQGFKDFRSQIWDSVFVQSVTDKFDSQSKITEKMGFSTAITREHLRDPKSKFYPPTEPDSNYFGFPETQVKPYIRDIIETARDNGRRFFISHLTSTTHHDWSLPVASGPRSRYMGHLGWQDHDDINAYLNTIKYADGWVAEIMDLLEDTGVLNETLVVITGDHGSAFREDDASYSTYNGAHITNFRVPLIFYHPKLPRLNLTIEATSQSILPTILDLLKSSNSLDTLDQSAASHLLNEYEGQSLLREYQPWHHQRQAWHVSLLAPGGTFLAISSAAFSWRLIMPLCHTSMFRFTDLKNNGNEEEKLEDWSLDRLITAVTLVHGAEAAQWVMDAKSVGTWWFWEKRRLWNFGGVTRHVHPGWNKSALY